MGIENFLNINGYEFKNYVILTKKEQEIALNFRNANRKWMINNDVIPLDEHIEWIKSLNNNKELIYYLVFKDNIPFMAIDFHDIDWKSKECCWGYFLGDKKFTSEVLKIEKIIIDIAFEYLKMKKLISISMIDNHVMQIHKFFGFKEDGIVTINDRDFLKMYLLSEVD